MRMRLSPPELNYHNAGVYSLGQREESWAVRRKALGLSFSCANYGSSSSVMQNVCGPGCYHSPSECCDSSFCFTVTRTRSSEERVLSTATLRTMLPFNPVSPACFDPLTVMI